MACAIEVTIPREEDAILTKVLSIAEDDEEMLQEVFDQAVEGDLNAKLENDLVIAKKREIRHRHCDECVEIQQAPKVDLPDIDLNGTNQAKLPELELAKIESELPEIVLNKQRRQVLPKVDLQVDNRPLPEINVKANQTTLPAVCIPNTKQERPSVDVRVKEQAMPNVTVLENSVKLPEVDVNVAKQYRPKIDLQRIKTRLPSVNVRKEQQSMPELNVPVEEQVLPNVEVEANEQAMPTVEVRANELRMPSVDVPIERVERPKFDVRKVKAKMYDVNVNKLNANMPEIDVNVVKSQKYDVQVPVTEQSLPEVNVQKQRMRRAKVNVQKLDLSMPRVDVNVQKQDLPKLCIGTRRANLPSVNVNKLTAERPEVNVDVVHTKRPQFDVQEVVSQRPNINVGIQEADLPDLDFIEMKKVAAPRINIKKDIDLTMPTVNIKKPCIGDTPRLSLKGTPRMAERNFEDRYEVDAEPEVEFESFVTRGPGVAMEGFRERKARKAVFVPKTQRACDVVLPKLDLKEKKVCVPKNRTNPLIDVDFEAPEAIGDDVVLEGNSQLVKEVILPKPTKQRERNVRLRQCTQKADDLVFEGNRVEAEDIQMKKFRHRPINVEVPSIYQEDQPEIRFKSPRICDINVKAPAPRTHNINVELGRAMRNEVPTVKMPSFKQERSCYSLGRANPNKSVDVSFNHIAQKAPQVAFRGGKKSDICVRTADIALPPAPKVRSIAPRPKPICIRSDTIKKVPISVDFPSRKTPAPCIRFEQRDLKPVTVNLRDVNFYGMPKRSTNPIDIDSVHIREFRQRPRCETDTLFIGDSIDK